MPDFRITGLEQDSSFAIQRDTQQGAVPFKVVPGRQEPLSIGGPINANQTIPSFYNQIARSARGGRTELDLVLARAIEDDCSFRAIGGQTPIERRFNLRRARNLAAHHVKTERFRTVSFGDAV